jgi:GT2 family glycosyltransferase
MNGSQREETEGAAKVSHSHDTPAVAAVVINMNGKELLADALDSLQKQDYSRLNIVVVDNGSTDGSQELVRRLFPEVTLIENEKNEGFGGANNQGIEYAIGHGADYVLLFNNDAVADKTCVSVLVKSVRKHAAGMIGPKIFYHGEERVIWSAGGVVDFWRGKIAHIGIRETDRGQYETPADVDYLTACAVLISKEVIGNVGIFDPAYHPIYGEDTDLCQRAKRAGYRLMFEPKAIVWHRISAFSGGGITAFKVRLRLQHEMLFFRRYARWYHWLTIPLFVPLRALGYVLRWMVQGEWRLIGAVWHGLLALATSRREGSSGRAERDGMSSR